MIDSAGAIDWLLAAGLVLKVNIVNTGHLPFKGYSKENFFKLLSFDVGILGKMSGLSPKTILDADYGSFKGFFSENFVAQELIHQMDELYSWQEGNNEIEFLSEIEGKVVPIEVKSVARTKAESLGVFVKKYHSQRQIVFSKRPLDCCGNTHYYPLYLAGKMWK